MSKTNNRRKSKRSSKPFALPIPKGPKLTFQWSVSASRLSWMEDSSTISLPPIDIEQSKRPSLPSSRSLIDQHSPRYSLVSNRESFSLPDLSKKRQSHASSSSSIDRQLSNKQSTSLPLLINYKEIHRLPSAQPVKQRKATSHSISTLSLDKSPSVMRRKVSFASNSSSSFSSHQLVNEQNHRLAPPTTPAPELTRKALRKNEQIYSSFDSHSSFALHVPMIKVS